MILALLSDVHANLEALEACLKHAHQNEAGGFAFLGDFVGYGSDATGVVSIIMQYAAQGAIVVKGNHDDALEQGASYMNQMVRESIDWARTQLSAEQRAFLAGLPLRVNGPRMCLVHASAATPERWTYIDSPDAALRSVRAAGAPYTFCGHVHDQLLFAEVERRATQYRPLAGSPIPTGSHRRWLALVGSVGQPRDGRPAAAYALFDDRAERMTFHRVPYDHHAAAEKIRKAGLSPALAHRVEKGI